MADPIAIIITAAGRDALVNAEAGSTDAIRVTHVGLSAAAFDAAPTLRALPGQFKRLDTIAGKAVSETVIHMVAQDTSADRYDLRGIGLFLADGTLFGSWSAPEPIFAKFSRTNMLLAFDIAFEAGVADAIEFGDSTFLYPPATETEPGVARIAPQARVDAEEDAGSDDRSIVTPKTLRVRLGALLRTIRSRKITGGGLATGGGDFNADRTITVSAATAQQVAGGTASDVALTPASIGPLRKSATQSGWIVLASAEPARSIVMQWGRFTARADGATSVTFPLAFSQPAYSVLVDGATDTSTDSQDNYPAVQPGTIGTTGFSAWNANSPGGQCCFVAIGEIAL